MPRPRTVTDEQILRAAVQAVGEVGPARLTLADVGGKVGLSPATLLQRFGSKRGMLLALAAHDADAMPARIRAASQAADPLAALVDVLSGFATALRDVEEFANHLSFLLMDLSDPDFRDINRRHARSVLQAIAEVLTDATSKGIVVGIPPDELALLVHSTYNGALIGWGMDPRGGADQAVAQRLRALFGLLDGRPTGSRQKAAGSRRRSGA